MQSTAKKNRFCNFFAKARKIKSYTKGISVRQKMTKKHDLLTVSIILNIKQKNNSYYCKIM